MMQANSNMKLLSIIILVFCVLLRTKAEDDYAIRNESMTYSAKSYVLILNRNALLSTPNWKPNDVNPPLSPRTAENIARKYLTELIPNSDGWKPLSITLSEPLEQNGKQYWLYEIRYASFRSGEWISGNYPELKVIVLMDGTVVKWHQK
jgi:hypothetical protein